MTRLKLPGFITVLVCAVSVFACGASDEGGQAASPSGDAHPLLGTAAPTFSRPAVVGGSGAISVDQLHGKVAIVDFWATWCEPCKKSFPKLEELKVKYEASGLRIVGVSEDDDAGGIPAFAKELGAKFPLVWDSEKSIAAKWQPKSMPTTFVIDRTGIVRFVHFGFHDGEEASIEQEVKSLL
ncbi:MAG: TlpA disulfide reductase family protein [Polyangiaceae bacterium]